MSAQRSTAFRVRVTILLAVLIGVITYAIRDVRHRRARNDWDHTLEIALVVLTLGHVDPAATDALRTRAEMLAARLHEERGRYRAGAPRPFAFRVYGPVPIAAPPPEPASDGIGDLARFAWEKHEYLADVDARASIDVGAHDVRVYVVATPAKATERAFVEGLSEDGGSVGFVKVELDLTMVDFALSVAAHELFHTLGATDKYDAQGRTKVPEGLAEPGSRAATAQRYVEIMARGRPVARGREVLLDSLDELAVGPSTAAEIKWSP
ncbi:MAG: hypothetical protein U0235_05925 [Polyangiaceae bacterium]